MTEPAPREATPAKVFRPFAARAAAFLAIVGPGVITANVDNDAGGIATYSMAGAQFGYSLLWVLLPVTLALIVVQEMSARLGAITGKGLADLIRENFGLRITFYLLLALLFTDIGNTVAEFAGWAAAMEVFGVPRIVSVPIGAFVVWWMIVKGTYRIVEKIFLVACTVYFTYVVSALLARPSWSEVVRQTFEPRVQGDTAWLLMIIGIVGTTIAPWMQFYLQSSIVEKRIGPDEYGISRWDVIVGCVMAAVVAFFIVVACGATLHPRGIQIHGAEEAALALEPLAGTWAKTLFALGLANASLFAASILPLATAYSICEGLGFEAGVNKTWSEAPEFLGLYTLHDRHRRRDDPDPRRPPLSRPLPLAGPQRPAPAVRPRLHDPPHQQGGAHGRARQRPLLERRRLGHDRGHGDPDARPRRHDRVPEPRRGTERLSAGPGRCSPGRRPGGAAGRFRAGGASRRARRRGRAATRAGSRSRGRAAR